MACGCLKCLSMSLVGASSALALKVLGHVSLAGASSAWVLKVLEHVSGWAITIAKQSHLAFAMLFLWYKFKNDGCPEVIYK